VSSLAIRVEDATPLHPAASPHLSFRLGFEDPGPGNVESILLQCLIRLEPQQRTYDAASRGRLFDLFGFPEQWGRTLRSLYWTQAQVVVPGFRQRTTLDLAIPCPLDVHAAATKYFEGLKDGEIPMTFQFSGTVFRSADGGPLQVRPIPRDREATFRLPIRVWKDLMDRFRPRTKWLELDPGVLNRLSEYKRRSGVEDWNLALGRLLDGAESRSSP
jgi:hypothetical protein